MGFVQWVGVALLGVTIIVAATTFLVRKNSNHQPGDVYKFAFGVMGAIGAVAAVATLFAGDGSGAPDARKTIAIPGPTVTKTVTATPTESSLGDDVAVTITSPADGTRVPAGCTLFNGTSEGLPAGKTLVLASHEPNNPWYIEKPSNWDEPSQMGTWQARVYFNEGDGDLFDVRAYVVDLAEVQEAEADPNRQRIWAVDTPPTSWERVAGVRVTGAASLPAQCT